MVLEFNGKKPDIDKAEFIAENATIIGDVRIGEGSSVWYGAVLRGDEEPITIGKNTNVQDNTVIHADEGKPVVVGDHVTIGHQCVIHGCMIEDNCLIGMGSIIMNGAHIRKNSLVGAGALVTENKDFPEGAMIIGSPAKMKTELAEEAQELIAESAKHYIDFAKMFSETCKGE